MKAARTSKTDLKKLAKPHKNSYKGQNGSVLVVAGSKEFHGASIFAAITASRLVDYVFFATPKENIPVAKKASPAFIVVELKEAERFAKRSDAILVGPGLKAGNSTRNLVHGLLSRHRGKKFVLDAAALRVLNPKKLHRNCTVTPHASEFKALFRMPASKENTLKAAKKYHCVVVLKGRVDFISDGLHLIENRTGNAGMTKGGTGDILAGLIAGFAAKNELLLSAKAGCYLNGYAADLLKKEKGLMWNAADLMEKLPEAKKRLERT